VGQFGSIIPDIFQLIIDLILPALAGYLPVSRSFSPQTLMTAALFASQNGNYFPGHPNGCIN